MPAMIQFAKPMASQSVSQAVLKEIESLLESKSLVSGIKACQKRIIKEPSGFLVLCAKTSPADLISHFPVLCEERNIPYVFVEDTEWMKGFTCVLLPEPSKMLIEELMAKEQ